MNKIQKQLFSKQDLKYRDFIANLAPTVSKDTFIGVRVPDIRIIAKQMLKDKNYDNFLDTLPHDYYEENILHSAILTDIKDYDNCLKRINEFLPYIDNWAVCDTLHPNCFKKHPDGLLVETKKWLKSKDTYTIRFGVNVLMTYYLDDEFDPKHLELVSKIKSKEYYVNMMRAWYFATAMAKQPQDTFIYLKERKLDEWTHLKTISKCVDSFRIDDKTKEILKGLR